MFEILNGFKKGDTLSVTATGTGKSTFNQLNQPTLEEILLELVQYGKPRVGMYGDDGCWYCAVEMNTNTVGADFKCASDFNMATPTDAAKQCLERVLKAVEQYRK